MKKKQSIKEIKETAITEYKEIQKEVEIEYHKALAEIEGNIEKITKVINLAEERAYLTYAKLIDKLEALYKKGNKTAKESKK